MFKNPVIMNNKELWQSALAQIQFQISKANFATWLKNTDVILKKEGVVVVSTPNAFSKEWLSNKYNKLIFKIIHDLDNEVREVKFIVKQGGETSLKTKSAAENGKLEIEQLKFEEFKINRETNLNPRYTFDNFVIGSFNELAHAAAWAVSQNPGLTYNPLFIYGGVGLGKTHLLQATGNKIIDNLKGKKIKYISSGKLVSSIVSAIHNHNIESFKSNLSLIDILIIDDVQFLAGKDKTQEEFFHIFNTLYEKNKQIILSSDRPPKAIPELEERLRSRFEGGMIADISAPDYETRLAILKTKLQDKNVNLSEEVLEFIANNIKKNIRELEGALNRVLIYYKTNNKSPDLEVVKKLTKSYIFSPLNITSYQKIIEVISKFYDLKEKDLFSPTRKKEIVKPRQIAMFFLRQELKYSFPAIARKFGGKDHTTVIYSYRKISEAAAKDDKLSEEIELIKQQIYSG